MQARFKSNRREAKPGRPPGSVGAGHLLSGLLKCGTCGGSFGLLYRRKKGCETYQTLGCVTHKSRGSAICANDKTISERKVRAAVVGHLRNVLTRTDRVEAFIEEFQRRYRELLETSGSRLKTIEGQIARQREHIEAVMAALVTVPGSKALGAKLATEEAKLSELEAERTATSNERPKVMPHPALIARYVEDLPGGPSKPGRPQGPRHPSARPTPSSPSPAGRRPDTKSPEPSTFRAFSAPESLKNVVAGA